MKRPVVYNKEQFALNIAKMKKGGETFEIVVDPDLAIEYHEKKGKGIDVKDVIKSEKVFHDANNGEVASEHKMKEVFGTDDPVEAAKIILEKGDVALTKEHLDKIREVKRKRIVDIIHRNAVDPSTHYPHPATRIENAMEQAKVKIDEMTVAEAQVQDVVKKLRTFLPIKFEIKEIEVILPAEEATKAYGTIKQIATVLNDTWQNDGSWRGLVEIPGGLEEEFYEKLNAVTHGKNECRVVKTK